MKIGFIIGSLSFGGAERVTVRLSKALATKGHTVVIYTIKVPKDKEYDLPELVQRRKCATGSTLSTIRKLRSEIINDSPDCIIIMARPLCTYCVPALFHLRIPFVVSERSSPMHARIKKTTALLSNYLMKKAAAYVFQTKNAMSYFSGIDKRSSFIIPNPIDLSELPNYYEGKRRNAIVAVGRLVPEKNYPFLIDAFCEFYRTHKEMTLEIYGSGQEESKIRDYIHQKGLDETILLMGNHPDVLSRIRDASLFILSSDFEGMPNALIEAMTIGLPVIATDCPSGGPADLIQNQVNGVLVPVRDCTQMVKAMNRIVEDRSFSNTLSTNALKLRTTVDIYEITQKWVEVIEYAINNTKRIKSKQ